MSEVPHPDSDPLGLYAAAKKSESGDPVQFATIATWLALGIGIIVLVGWWSQPTPPVTVTEAERIPLNATVKVSAANTFWQTVLDERGQPAVFSPGDRICVSGGVQNTYLTERGKRMTVGPSGLSLQDQQAFESFVHNSPYDGYMPALSLMYQFDNDIKTRHYFTSECIQVKSHGKQFQLMVNIPYHDNNDQPASDSANGMLGGWLITRVDK